MKEYIKIKKIEIMKMSICLLVPNSQFNNIKNPICSSAHHHIAIFRQPHKLERTYQYLHLS